MSLTREIARCPRIRYTGLLHDGPSCSAQVAQHSTISADSYHAICLRYAAFGWPVSGGSFPRTRPGGQDESRRTSFKP